MPDKDPDPAWGVCRFEKNDAASLFVRRADHMDTTGRDRSPPVALDSCDLVSLDRLLPTA